MARRRYYYYYLLATAAYFFTGCGVAAPAEATAIVEIPFVTTISLPGETVGWSRYHRVADQRGVPDEDGTEGKTEKWKRGVGVATLLWGVLQLLFPNLISKGNKKNQQAVSRIQEEHDQTRQEIGRFLAQHEAQEKVDRLQNEVRRLLKVHDDTREEVRDLVNAQGKALKRNRRECRMLLLCAFLLIAWLWWS